MRYICAIGLFLCLCACKKSNNTAVQNDSFYKIYPEYCYNYADAKNLLQGSGEVATDDAGNIYVWYFDRSNYFTLLKTDKNGMKQWSKSNFTFTPGYYSFVGVSGYKNFSKDMVCIGQTLFVSGFDSTGHLQILKFNCADGNYTGNIDINALGINRPGLSVTSLGGLQKSKSGNLFILANNANSTTPVTGVVALINTEGAVLMSVTDFKAARRTQYDYDNVSSINELPDGSYEIAGAQVHYSNITNTGSDRTYNMSLTHIDQAGAIIRIDTFPVGKLHYEAPGYLTEIIPTIRFISMFRMPDGSFVTIGNEQYDQNADLRIKITKISSDMRLIDSAYIGAPTTTTRMSNRIQLSDGSILLCTEQYFIPIANTIVGIYLIKTDGTVTPINPPSLTNQSAYISGLALQGDGHIIMAGKVQPYGEDTTKIFILKNRSNAQY